MFALSKILGRPTAIKAFSTSAVAHVAAVGAVLAWGWLVVSEPVEQAEFLGDLEAIELEVRAPQPPVEIELLEEVAFEMRVVITPNVATLDDQRFVQTSVSSVALLDMTLPETESGSVPPPAIDLPRREPQVEALVRMMEEPTPQIERQRTTQAQPVVLKIPEPRTAGSETKTPPRFVSNRPPIYPAEAARRGFVGRTLLRVTIAPTGRVQQVEVARSSGHPILDASAVQAVRSWRAEPARRGGFPVETVELLPIIFRLPTR